MLPCFVEELPLMCCAVEAREQEVDDFVARLMRGEKGRRRERVPPGVFVDQEYIGPAQEHGRIHAGRCGPIRRSGRK